MKQQQHVAYMQVAFHGVTIHFYGICIHFPGATIGRWPADFEYYPASASGAFGDVLAGFCISAAQAFTGQHPVIFDRWFSWIYSGYFSTEFQFIVHVATLSDLSPSWHSISCR